MTIEVEHNGHMIRYSENNDVWRCWKMNVEAKTLSALKSKLNKLDADARRVENVPVFKIQSYGGLDGHGMVTLLEGDSAAWVTFKEKNGAQHRSKENLANLVLDTPETREAIKKAKTLDETARAASQKASDAWKAITRLTLADLKPVSDATKEAVND